MKKLLLNLALGSLIFASACRKDHTEDPGSVIENTEKVPVEFSLSTFTQTIVDLKSGIAPHTLADTLNNHISYLYCRIYNDQQQLVFSEDQTASNPSFGKINSVLGPGNHYAVFMGSKSPVQLNAGAAVTLSNASMQFDQGAPTPDAFVKRFSFSVSGAPVSHAIKMTRIVAGLNVIIEDAIPSAVKNIQVSISEEQYMYKFSDSTRSGVIPKSVNFPITAAEAGATNKTLKSYVFKVNVPTTTVIVKAYNETNVLLYEKTIPNVTFYVNKVTTLTGKLFSSQATYNVTTNTVWDTPAPVVSF
jgi:hypothetical protein